MAKGQINGQVALLGTVPVRERRNEESLPDWVRMLAAAILQRAVDDARSQKGDQSIGRQARHWLAGEIHRDDLYFWCDAAGIDSRLVVEFARRRGYASYPGIATPDALVVSAVPRLRARGEGGGGGGEQDSKVPHMPRAAEAGHRAGAAASE